MKGLDTTQLWGLKEARIRKVSSIGTVSLSPQLKGKYVLIIEREDGTLLILPKEEEGTYDYSKK